MNHKFSEVKLARYVHVSAKRFKGLSPPHQPIIHRLLQGLLQEKASKEHGYFLAVTAFKSISQTKYNNNPQRDVFRFRVSFTCRTFLPRPGDILQGIVKRVEWNIVFIWSEPLRFIGLPSLKMPGYHYVPAESEGEKPYFQRDDLSKIAVGVVLRFKVFDMRFKESQDKRTRDFYIRASIEDDALGPISLVGSDEPYM